MRNEAEREGEEEERERSDQPDQARIEIVQREGNNNNDAHLSMLFNTLIQLIQMIHDQMSALRAQVASVKTRLRQQTWLLDQLVDAERRRTQMRRSSAPFAIPEDEGDIDVVSDADDEESLHHLIEHELPRIDLERE